MKRLLHVMALVAVSSFGSMAAAQPKKQPKAAPAPAPAAGGGDAAPLPKKDGKAAANKEKNFDFNGIDLNGRMRTPQLLYFLERANEELERASLEKRSFIPNMTKSIEDEQL